MSELTLDVDSLAKAFGNPHIDVVECDQMAWAFLRRIDYPLTHYDHETWLQLRQEGEPEARLASSLTACLRKLADDWPDNSVDIKARGGHIRIRILISGLEIGVHGEFQGPLALENAGRGLAAAYLMADTNAKRLQQRLYQVEGLAAVIEPYSQWPIEKIGSRYHAVNHAHRLACVSGMTQAIARDYSTMNHKGNHGLMLCRERYEKLFPGPAPESDTLAP